MHDSVPAATTAAALLDSVVLYCSCRRLLRLWPVTGVRPAASDRSSSAAAASTLAAYCCQHVVLAVAAARLLCYGSVPSARAAMLILARASSARVLRYPLPITPHTQNGNETGNSAANLAHPVRQPVSSQDCSSWHETGWRDKDR